MTIISSLRANVAKHPVLTSTLAVAFTTVIYIALNFSRFLKKGTGYAVINGAAAFVLLISIYYILKSLKRDDAELLPWPKLLKSFAYWRGMLYLAVATLIAGLLLGVTQMNHFLRAFFSFAAAGHIAVITNFSANDFDAFVRRWRPVDFLLFNLSVGLILLEVALRVLPSFYASPFFINPRELGMRKIKANRLKPGQKFLGFKVNSHGFVDGEFIKEKQAGTKRIVAIGDSFAVGVVPYEQNFITLLEDQLSRCGAGGKVEVYNMGIAGTSPVEYDALLDIEGMQYKPDHVLICFFVGNDFIEPPSRSNIYPEDFAILLTARRLLALRSKPGADNAWEVSEISQFDPDQPTFSEDVYVKMEKDRFRIVTDAAQNNFFARYKPTFDSIRNMRDLAKGHITIAVIPDEFQVDPSLANRLIASGRGAPDVDMPQKKLLAFCESEHIECIDLLPALRQAQYEKGPVYKPRDSHWNKLGNEVAAKTLAEKMNRGKCEVVKP